MALRISRAFKDISLSFAKHPVTNDILTLKNEDAIKRSVINLIRTRIGEKFFNTKIGTSIESSLFELTGQEVTIILKEDIMSLIRNYEPRVRLKDVIVEVPSDTNELNVTLEYDIVGQGFPRQNIEFILQPTRI
jgi:phage baseplate assembly protein W